MTKKMSEIVKRVALAQKIAFFIIVAMCFLSSCAEDYQPLPLGQMRIALPTHEYTTMESYCPYVLEAPVYARFNIRRAPDKSCWSDIKLPPLRAVIHMTYRELDNDLERTLNETQDLTYSHVGMADNILDETISYPSHDVYGTLFMVEGNVASNIQFYVTDSVNHFLRGALYFNTAPNKDSLAPVIVHVKADIQHLISTIQWKD
jgi:gliding motility-associated lipoprotein GldD